jgi:hypothetical protein
MFNLGKNKYFVAGFAILMAVGLMAAYIPMLFPQTPATGGIGSGAVFGNISGNISGDISSTANLNQTTSLSGNAGQTVTSTPATTTPAHLPAGFSGLQTEQNSLSDINNLLNQSQ